ncbi:MAG: MMPL family transporter [Dehalococcoidia bacterium]|nr:MMPL family transporter [Dehalococcoidia bacterium]
MSWLERWARFSHRNRGKVILGWVLVLAALVGLAQAFGGEYENSVSLPGSETQEGMDILQASFPARAGDSADLVFQSEAGLADASIRQRIEQLLADVATIPGVVGVESPYETPGAINQDGTIGRAAVRWESLSMDTPKGDIESMLEKIDAAEGEGLRIEAGGDIVAQAEFPEFGSEGLGLIAAVIILFIAFGSVVAMGLPIGAALFGLGAGTMLVALATRFMTFPDWTAQFMAMIGIGVGIDYSLLVVTRFREGLHSGRSVEDSVALAVTTSGRAVMFAGVVVAIAFFGLYAMGLPFIAAVGTGGAIVVACAVIVAITLMPAFLSLVGHRVDSWRVPFLHSTEGVDEKSGWYRFSSAIQKQPLPWFAVGVVSLLVLASPVLDMTLGFTDAGNNPPERRTRQAYDLLAEAFGPGFNGPLIVVTELNGAGEAELARVSQAIAADPNVAAVTPPAVSPAGDAAVWTLFAKTKPQDEATGALVHRLRDDILPSATAGTALDPKVTGSNAGSIDAGDRIAERMPLLFGAVISLSFLLLMMVFRSVLVALKAAIMNLLSIGAAYGVVVAVFQWGWFGGLLGVDKGPVETFLPMMFFAILFGLSMDYEVFLISRIREEYIRSGNNALAVRNGLAATARVITAAAAIMVAVFLAFVLGEDRIVKELGLGMATAIFVDATVVRLILVPATMELLGDANWWLPKWLDRLLPHVNLEGVEAHEVHPDATGGATAPAGGK